MKIRTGFVSNSSSSSFIIHRSYLTDEQVKKMKNLYERLSDEELEDGIYDDSGAGIDISKNYVHWTGYSTPQEWDDFIESLNLPEDAIFSYYS